MRVERALSIFIAKYPNHATLKTKSAISAFVLAVNRIYKTHLTAPHADTRDDLTSWAQSQFVLWEEADQVVESPKLWGPIMWDFLFDISNRYRDSMYREYSMLFVSLVHLLPCKECAAHFKKMFSKNLHRWHQVRTQTDCTNFVQWMRDTIKVRVDKKYFGR